MYIKTKNRPCKKCGEIKNISEFYKSSILKDGEYNSCKNCERKRARKNYTKNIVKNRKISLDNYYKHRDIYIIKNKIRENKNKDDVFNHYGGYKCSCCGETIKEFLTIDHIKGGGTKHRKEVNGGGRTIYRWIRKNNYPKGFRVLCFNCNCGRALNNGICPHKNR
jgi:hypothetical protein